MQRAGPGGSRRRAGLLLRGARRSPSPSPSPAAVAPGGGPRRLRALRDDPEVVRAAAVAAAVGQSKVGLAGEVGRAAGGVEQRAAGGAQSQTQAAEVAAPPGRGGGEPPAAPVGVPVAAPAAPAAPAVPTTTTTTTAAAIRPAPSAAPAPAPSAASASAERLEVREQQLVVGLQPPRQRAEVGILLDQRLAEVEPDVALGLEGGDGRKGGMGRRRGISDRGGADRGPRPFRKKKGVDGRT